MKKLLSISLATLMSLMLFTGCGGNKTDGFVSSSDITVISREDGSGTRGAFVEIFNILEKDDAGNSSDKTTLDAVISNKTDVVLSNVAGDINSIGYVSVGSLNDSVKPVAVDGIMLTTDSIKNKSYSASRFFNLVSNDSLSPLATDFKNFILSSDGQAVVSSSYVSAYENADAFVSNGESGSITVAGSTSVAPIMEKLAEKYKEFNPSATIEIQSTGSSAGITSVIDGTADLGMSSRELKPTELTKVNSIPMAIDAIAIIVNPINPIENLSSTDIHNIFTGTQTVWSDFVG